LSGTTPWTGNTHHQYHQRRFAVFYLCRYTRVSLIKRNFVMDIIILVLTSLTSSAPRWRTNPFVRQHESSAFQADFWCWFLPQNSFCGYETSAFQAKKHPRRQKSIAFKAFNSPPHLCLKGNNIFSSMFCNYFIITFSQWIHWHIDILNSCLKGNNFHNRRSSTCGLGHH
jgi:hypothetical protein